MNSLEKWLYWKDLLPDYLERNYEELGFLQEVIEVEPDGYGGTNRVFYFKEGVFYTCLSHWNGGNFMDNHSYEHTALSKEAFAEILNRKKASILSTLSEDEKLEFEAVFNDVTSLLFSKYDCVLSSMPNQKGTQSTEEKIIIKGKLKDIKKFCIGIGAVGVIISVLYFIRDLIEGIVKSDGALPYIWLAIPVFALIAFCLYKVWSKTELTVSDKRVYGCAAGGKRVDLPLDSVSAVGTSAFNGIAITTASGSIKFSMMENRDEIHSAISKLLVERQGKPVAAAPVVKQEIPQSNADELKKYKELLDMGAISQEEFDAKKKQLLGL